MKRTIASAAALCLALGLVLTGCGSKDKAVYVQQVSSLTGISSQDRFTGLVVSENLMEIKKDSDKEVAELLVKEGQDVQEGDPLFSYDTDQLQLNADKLDLEREQLSASISDYDTQIGELERERDKVSANKKLQYTIQIQSAQVSQKEAELNLKTKEAELEKAKQLLENATITAPIAGRIQSINESGTDSQGNPAAYITIQQAGAYRVKGTIGELQQGAIAQGDRIRLTSRVDSSKTWLGTVTLVDYENPVKNDNNGYYSSSDSSNMASKYPFYVELDSVEGLIMGQHLYMERYTEGDDETGVIVSSAYLCYEDDGSAYVWAENSRSKLEKRAVTLGTYNENTDNYVVTEGLSETDYIAFPDEQYCHVGAPTSHTPVTYENEEGGADTGGADMGGADMGGADMGGADMGGADMGGADMGGADMGGMDTGMDADMGDTDAGMDTGMDGAEVPEEAPVVGAEAPAAETEPEGGVG